MQRGLAMTESRRFRFRSRERYRSLTEWTRWSSWTVPMLVCATFGASCGWGEQPEAAESENRVLVLYDGRVVRGTIRPVIDGFVVRHGDAETHIPLRQVRVAADSLSRAYQRLRNTLPAEVASSHLALARWCLSNGLLEESRFELLEVLRLDAQNPVARSMLQKLDAVLTERERSPAHPPEPPKDGEPDTVAATSTGSMLPPESTVVSREAMRRFVRQIQPLLLNRCGNARCHGTGTDGSFALANVPRSTGGYRVSSQRNLKEVLAYIDVRRPEESPLLSWASRQHGNAPGRILGAPLSKAQLESLEAWVKSVAGQPSDAAHLPAEDASGLDMSTASARSATAMSRRVDPFDPEEFNRRFGASKKGRGESTR